MKKSYLLFSFIAIIATVDVSVSYCKKLNESTDLGGGLIPPVDNITTFDTSITVQTYMDTMKFADDSIRLGAGEEFFLGKINSDPIFGKTDARVFLELKPATYPYAFLNKSDSLFIDSVVLVLDYVESYGDTITPQTVNVYEIDQASNFKPDSAYLIRRNDFTYLNQLGTKTFAPQTLKDSVKVKYDTAAHQLRIKLDNTFGDRLLKYDSTGHPVRGAYANDSVFRSKFKGFALQSINSGNAVMGFDLAGGSTKLAIYYKYEKRVNSAVQLLKDTVSYFTFQSGGLTAANSAAAEYVIRDYSGTPVIPTLNNGTLPDPVLFLQNTPGTFATVKIPDLGSVNNRVVHRAELYMEEIYDPTDTLYRAPDYMYVDAIDPTIGGFPKFRTIPYDLNYGSGSSLDLGALGAVPVMSTDGFGNRIRTWRFNLTRYVQHVLTHTQSLYDLRVFPAFRFVEQLGIPPGDDILTSIFVNPAIIKGRIRLGGGNHASQKMKLRIIYSKL